MATIYEKNFLKLEELLGGNLQEVFDKYFFLKLKAKGYMDLSVDITGKNTLVMAHNFEMNGDLVPDPDMVIEIDFNNKTAEALSFQNQFIYNAVYDYDEEGKKTAVRPRLKHDLNIFLSDWLYNIKIQGHTIAETEGK